MGIQVCKIKGLAPIGAQKGVKKKLKNSSFHELAVQILRYLTYSILGTWFVKFVHKNYPEPTTYMG